VLQHLDSEFVVPDLSSTEIKDENMKSSFSKVIREISTPYKLGKPVITGSGIQGRFDYGAVDVPFVFYHRDQFHMLYVGFDGDGYQTALASSDDLIHWELKGIVLKRSKNKKQWDHVGAAGTWIIKETNNLFEIPTLKKIDNRYWMVYHSYPEVGYERGPAKMGLAWSEDEDLLQWNRLDKPIYSWEGGNDWEKGGLYKACIIEYDGLYYMFYNAKDKDEGPWTEQIGVATSSDLFHWNRFPRNPVLKVTKGAWDSRFVSDPNVFYDGTRWLMFYYGFDGNHAQEGCAVSEDLLHWIKIPNPIVCFGNPGQLDEIHAHKAAIIYYNGILYHFYCAVRKYKEGDPTKNYNEFRCITVATSKSIKW